MIHYYQVGIFFVSGIFMRLMIGLLSVLLITGCEVSQSANDKPTNLSGQSIANVQFIDVKTEDKKEDHKIVVNFSRPFTKDELKTERGMKTPYLLGYEIYFKDGNKTLHNDDLNLVNIYNLDNTPLQQIEIAREGAYYPPHSYDETIDKRWHKENLSKVVVWLYKQDNKFDPNSTDPNIKKTLVETKTFNF